MSQPPGCPPGMQVAFLTKIQEIVEPSPYPVYYARLEPIPPGETSDSERVLEAVKKWLEDTEYEYAVGDWGSS